MQLRRLIPLVSAICLLVAGCGGARMAQAEAQWERGEYNDAAATYRKVYNRLSPRKERAERGKVAFRMGECYEKLNRPANASVAFMNARRYEYPDSSLLLRLGRALQAEGKYAKAIEAYTEYLVSNSESALAAEGIRGCRMALSAKEGRGTRYVVKEAKNFNSSRADFSPMFAGKDYDRLYFTSSSEKSKGAVKSGITGMRRCDIFVSEKDQQGRWQAPVPLKGDINSEADEGVISFSPDGQLMYLSYARPSSSGDTGVEIYTSRRTDATWSAPRRLELGIDSVYATGHPAVSPDGQWLYFVSDMPGGYGGKDIWRVRLSGHGNPPQNLGPQINTPGNEMFPYLRSDSLLYFSSDGHPGFGGLDIFKARLNSTGDFWTVDNMGIPLNSSGDDFGIVFMEGERGYMSSNRRNARGYDSLYSFELPDLSIGISGIVLDKDEEPVVGAVIRIVGRDGSMQKTKARDDGTFRFRLDRGVGYVMQAGAPGYLNMTQEFVSDEAEEDAEYEVEFSLVAVHKPQVVENIFYDFDKATLRPESKTALDDMARILKENPNVAIEMGAHTDRKGSEAYNEKLSERRAKSVVDYLVSVGIQPDRLSWKGYGKTTPKRITRRLHRLYPQFAEGTLLTEQFILSLPEKADREAADQINRRTEFKVTSTDYDM